jgi:hypothetical protein
MQVSVLIKPTASLVGAIAQGSNCALALQSHFSPAGLFISVALIKVARLPWQARAKLNHLSKTAFLLSLAQHRTLNPWRYGRTKPWAAKPGFNGG